LTSPDEPTGDDSRPAEEDDDWELLEPDEHELWCDPLDLPELDDEPDEPQEFEWRWSADEEDALRAASMAGSAWDAVSFGTAARGIRLVAVVKPLDRRSAHDPARQGR
jgi:hypothetical protein